jgi:hypothetical protein
VEDDIFTGWRGWRDRRGCDMTAGIWHESCRYYRDGDCVRMRTIHGVLGCCCLWEGCLLYKEGTGDVMISDEKELGIWYRIKGYFR